ncbi:MAG: nuclear transport factor 2 family protein [Pseudomonadota bacterium]
MGRSLSALLVASFLVACTTTTSFLNSSGSTIRFEEDEIEIRAVLAAQAASWNRGDIDAFMEGYWRSADLRFGSGDTVVKGWQSTLMRYQNRYPDGAAMGELSFRELDVELLSDDAAVVHGAWQLQREEDTPGGLFTLIFRDFGDGWVIVSDTTTSGE